MAHQKNNESRGPTMARISKCLACFALLGLHFHVKLIICLNNFKLIVDKVSSSVLTAIFRYYIPQIIIDISRSEPNIITSRLNL